MPKSGADPMGRLLRPLADRALHQCRFTAGDPFRPAKRLLGLQTASRGNKQLVFEVPVYPATYQYPMGRLLRQQAWLAWRGCLAKPR
eukprot:g1465.t1